MRTPRPTLQRLTGGLAVLALTATLTACGGNEPESADDPAPVSSSSSATADDPTASAATGATDEPVEFDDELPPALSR